MQKEIGTRRILEVDLLRGIAVFLMILFHIFFDLNYFYQVSFLIFQNWLGDVIRFLGAGIFIFLVGVSAFLFFSKNANQRDVDTKYLRDGFYIFGLGMLITFVTFFFDTSMYVKFGILHFIGCAKLILPYYVKLTTKIKSYVILAVLFIGYIFEQIYLDTNFFSFLGIRGGDFSSLDYYPLFPWLALVFLGELIASLIYKGGRVNLIRKTNILSNTFIWAGKNSLIIYLLHQPILLGLFYLIFKL